ncbi:hypothetical protein AB0J90_26190 [Micromonospora sp. NPDC049523]|uniref:hypothetical protein n=1 Tax=Micromonospora sp. NPDC049523 TaxID=3155921 RepID=UPI00343D3F56
MPEVMQVLDAHVSPATDRAPAIREIFGKHLQTLLRLDHAWTTTHLRDILPTEPEHARAYRAAWNGHLESSPTDAGWALLRPQYMRAVETLTPTTDNEWAKMRASRLAFHLGNRFWFGQLDLDDPDGLLRRFYERAPAEATSTIIGSAGRTLKREEPIDPGLRDRLVRLWEHRIDAVRDGSDPTELLDFGLWFVNGEFDDAWSLAQLRDVLVLDPDVGLDLAVLRRLHTLAPAYPQECLRVLERFAGRPDHHGGVVRRNETLIRDIIAAACVVDDAAASAATRLVSAFAADGFDFRKSLDGNTGPSAEN